MAKNLVIVESPAKAKTIEKYLGSDYQVKSSFGHIRDLPKKGLNIDIANKFEPTYEVSADKKKVVAELRKAAKGATVWLASDEDREGEAIAWHLAHALKLDPKTTKRIVFHEITKPAILAAIDKPRTIDQQLVDAQQARRILDRLVGYELSPVLWKKVRTGLSAGRVQSVSVRLIVEREREIKAFEAVTSYKVTAVFDVKSAELKAELTQKLTTKPEALKFLEEVTPADYTVTDITAKPSTRSPGAPFTTSSLQQEAARRLGYSVKQTMTLAQRLYENGHITYMRTDSTNLAEQAIQAAGDYISKEYGAKYHHQRRFKTKNSSAQEAHEAIRPTNFAKTSLGDDAQQIKLYELIWRRTLASQMAPAQLERSEITIQPSTVKPAFIAKGEVLQFDGYLKVYGGGKDDTILPEVSEGQKLPLKVMTAEQSFSKPPARYSEAALVKKLEELGIGRPSTYAPTISTIQTRGYIEKTDLEGRERSVEALVLEKGKITATERTEVTGADRNKLVPTPIADMTTDFLVKHFAQILDYDFTAKAEQGFDDIADGKESWQKMLDDFYKKFHPLIEASANVSREETSQARKLGTDPKSGKPVIARYGRYGPMLQIGEAEDDEKPRFAPMPANANLEDVTFEQAMEMFKLPRTVGTTPDGQEIKANIGRFGPYIQVGKLFVSIKDHDPLTISEKDAQAAYAEKLQKEADKYIQRFDSGIDVINGPYGPYITDGKKNAKIPKDQEPAKLTEAECKKLLADAPAKGKGRRNFKRKPTKKK
ncbi:MAG: topoisomerase [Patescibacteria group bacterium]|nr:topoisomerase [Patescibacteria group bacterium]